MVTQVFQLKKAIKLAMKWAKTSNEILWRFDWKWRCKKQMVSHTLESFQMLPYFGLRRAPSLRALRDKLRLLKPMVLLGSFGFCKRCVVSWYLPQGAKKKFGAFFVKAQTLPDATPPVGKIHPFIKMAVTFEPIQQLWCPSVFIISVHIVCFTTRSTILNHFGLTAS